MVNKDGFTYFIPANDRDGNNKINGVCKWEQAFRVYAAIYCQENPLRSAEIWQYIYVINTVASTFQWDNVAWYDYTFRQLMAAKPNRSWAKIYNQFWNLAMRNPISSSSNNSSHNRGGVSYNGSSGNRNFGQSSSHGHGGGRKKYGDWHDNCCWNYNKHGNCRRKNCSFDNRCSYCGSWSHGLNTCPKANGNGNNNNNNANTNGKK